MDETYPQIPRKLIEPSKNIMIPQYTFFSFSHIEMFEFFLTEFFIIIDTYIICTCMVY